MHDNLIAPFFFSEETVTGRSYLDMLELYALPQLPAQTILQQDGAQPHFCHLDREMAGGWIAGPPRSSDLTPLDSFLWSYAKNTVYQVETNDLHHLKARIRDAVATVTPNMLQATWNDVEYQLHIFRATKGAHIEIY
jgi:hypothetical protein